MSSTAANLWVAGLAIAIIVLLVAGALLTVVLRLATSIDNGAKEIWTAGKQVANATVELSLLRRTNQLVADVNEAATGILVNARRIAHHSQSCPGCPRCVLSASGSGCTGGNR
jgi:uncharacterized protein YoxC